MVNKTYNRLQKRNVVNELVKILKLYYNNTHLVSCHFTYSTLLCFYVFYTFLLSLHIRQNKV